MWLLAIQALCDQGSRTGVQEFAEDMQDIRFGAGVGDVIEALHQSL
ncbi:MAG: hypothetical protein ACI89X_001438 [Planctomycetota bacterium]|jgi:hypothetical protein